MSALEDILNKSSEEVMQEIVSLGIRNYGVYQDELAKVLENAKKESRNSGKAAALAAGLNNSDTKGVLLEVLEKDPQRIFCGMKIAAHALAAEEVYLYLPESAKELAAKLSDEAEKMGIRVEVGLIDRRAIKEAALCHIIALGELADAFTGKKEEGIYLSVNGGEVKKVPKDIKLSELLDTEHIKAVAAGYRLLTPEELSVTAEEAGIENGVLLGLTTENCIVKEVEEALMQSKMQSCGKCVFCREGLIQLVEMHKDTTGGKGKMEYIHLVKEIGSAMEFSSLCSMGQKSAEIALSAIEKFPEEYEAHIKKRNCPAGVCTSFTNIYIDPLSCNGCGDCMDVCPADCIEGKSGYIHMIEDIDCIKCGKCIPVCEEEAVILTTGKVPKLPLRLTKVGKFKKH